METRYVAVSGAGTDEEVVVAHFDTLAEAQEYVSDDRRYGTMTVEKRTHSGGFYWCGE